MFLTTEPSLSGKIYTVLKVIVATSAATAKGITLNSSSTYVQPSRVAIEQALGQLYQEGSQLQADAVIGIQITMAQVYNAPLICLIGTAIKYSQAS